MQPVAEAIKKANWELILIPFCILEEEKIQNEVQPRTGLPWPKGWSIHQRSSARHRLGLPHVFFFTFFTWVSMGLSAGEIFDHHMEASCSFGSLQISSAMKFRLCALTFLGRSPSTAPASRILYALMMASQHHTMMTINCNLSQL